DDRFIGPLEAGTLEPVLQQALAHPDGTGQIPEPDVYVSTHGPVLSTRFGDPDGTWWDAYVAGGGYAAATKALSMAPAQIIAEVSSAGLRGLGGAGFSTGKKWSFIPKAS